MECQKLIWRDDISPDHYFCQVTALTENETKNQLALSMPKWIPNEKVKDIRIYTKSFGKSIQPSLRRIPRELFIIFPSLRRLKIHSEVHEIVAEDFFTADNQSELTGLLLSGNKLTVIRRNNFIGLFVLEQLDLSNNEIHSVENSAFAGLSRLQYLDLRNNQIKVLMDNVFDGLISVKGLHLGGNGLQNIESSLYLLSSVEKIILNFNHISDIDLTEFAKLPRLNKLDLESAAENLTNNAMNISTDEPILSPLEVLNVADNDLTLEAVFKIFYIFPHLKKINLAKNEIASENIFEEIQRHNTLLIDLVGVNSTIEWPIQY